MEPALQTLRVMAIDDEPFQLKLLTQQFKALGVHDVQTCDAAATALARLQADPGAVDLVCCDLQMPDMDGIEFVRHLGQTAYGGGLVLISGEDRSILQAAERLASSKSYRLCGAFHKPIQQAQLAESLKAATARAAGPRPTPARAGREYSAAEVARAIERGELINHYQPKVELATGRWVGVETLARWQHPEDGLVFPDQFIGVAEKHGLIGALTQAVLWGPNGAFRQARAWHEAGLSVLVSVNVSMDDLRDHRFPDLVVQAASAAGVAPSQLIVELTESCMMKDRQAALDILTRLRLKRIGLSIDDFGTGHSNLTLLHEVPFDELKVDRSFVHGACREDSLRAILLPSLDMAQHLGIKTVAEGVEDLDDWNYLRAKRCNLAQGYFIARPMRAEALAGWAAEWAERCKTLVPDPGR